MSEKIPLESLTGPLLRDADLCVKCGLCLAHCPTYRVTLNEAESPRGRIALMQGLATGMLVASAPLEAHLDGCLTCRACEVVCPADVPYGQLIDAGRVLLAQARPERSHLPRLLATVLVNKPLRFGIALLLWLYQRLGLQWLVRRTGVLGRSRLARIESLLPRIHLPRLPAPSPSPYPLPRGEGEKRVALFANCTSPLVEPETLRGAVTLLERLGCAVSVPASQTCCGALHQHSGLAAEARRCANGNLGAFAAAEAVVGVASGCTAQLVEYDLLLEDAAAGAFARKVQDIHGFLASHPRLDALRFGALPARALLHTPCTLRNVVKGETAVRTLLGKIPDLDVQPMDSACCGAAGSYFLTQPAMADTLAQAKVDQVRADRPDFVLSSNVGCAMHLAASLRRAGIKTPVWHPLRVLAARLAD